MVPIIMPGDIKVEDMNGDGNIDNITNASLT